VSDGQTVGAFIGNAAIGKTALRKAHKNQELTPIPVKGLANPLDTPMYRLLRDTDMGHPR